ncbi:30S ribosomal protein S12 methylthiotransferase RimO [Anaerostipes faecalis]|uniref:30S ribosomal protein S12 methylthiotransferase RimO n=1 Tax=Anaerostipes faecalis TaxID=2738446 RepID=UPI001C1DF9D0|nr:30S ribosomal protein S12 methylthiotransferase RimO [Anaerostipes faecalis]
MKILFISLGCDKNLVDSEVMLGLLTKNGYTLTDDETQADVIVINTCCFIHDAKEESINTILEMAQYKEQNLKALVVAGCLAERYKDEILKEIPEIDAVLGTTSYDSIVEAVNNALAGKVYEHYESIDYLPDNSDTDRVVTTGNHMAYLKIAEGCDKRCSYCIIPKIRGHFRSVPMKELLEEAGRLAEDGVKELVLVAQETTLYGKDLTGEKQLPLLLRKLCEIEGIEWIRLLYCYPEEITDELIEVMKTEEKICHYIDMPIQHSENRILQRMGRRTSREDLIEVIGKLRKEIPDIAIRTTLITGFPGETQEDHHGLMKFVEECRFERLGVFTYSPEEDTLAAEFEDQIDEEVKEQRRDEIMMLQQEISFENAQKLVGKVIRVMVEGYLYDDDIYVGRSYMDAPKVDGCVFINSPEELMTGDFVYVRITQGKEYDVIGEVEYEFTK